MKWRRKKTSTPGRRNGLEKAIAERQESERRLEAVRANVVRPLREKANQNQFAELIRASLEGR